MTSEATEVIRLNSVQIEDNSRGTTVTAKAYGTTVQEAEDEAVASIQRLRARLGRIDRLQANAQLLAEACIAWQRFAAHAAERRWEIPLWGALLWDEAIGKSAAAIANIGEPEP